MSLCVQWQPVLRQVKGKAKMDDVGLLYASSDWKESFSESGKN